MRRFGIAQLIIIVCLFLVASVGQVRAQSGAQPYTSYTIGSDGRIIPIPDPYVLDHVIDGVALGIGDMSAPEDIFIDRETDYLYIADAGNNRIIELDADGRVTRQIGPELGLDSPNGVYKDPRDGTLWIADTRNVRILQSTLEGELLKEFGPPQAEELAGIKTSGPTKVLVDKRGYIYFLEGTGAGMIVMDQENRFRGFFGTNKLGFSLKWLWSRYFASEIQREKLFLALPTAHTDMFLGQDGFMYTAVAAQSSQQIQKLSPVGANVFVDTGSEQRLYKTQEFGERRLPWEPAARLVGVTVDNAGVVTTVDASAARLYQYDQDRNLLMAFGRQGVGRVQFALPSEVEVDSRGFLYVLDSPRSMIYVLRPTEFARSVHGASALQYDGRYADASSAWAGVLDSASNYELAHSGMGAAAYHEEDWREAMRRYALARDQLGYSLAFHEYRQGLLRRSMGWLVSGALVLVIGVLVWPRSGRRGVRRRRDEAMRESGGTPLPAWLYVLVRPIQTFQWLAVGRSMWPALILVFLAGVARTASLATIAFHMRATPTVGSLVDWVRLYRPVAATLLPELRWEDTNLIVELLRIAGPWALWAVANYGVSALFDGEGTFRGVIRTTAYCLVPYIIFAVPIALLSHIMTVQERGLYETLWSLVYYWVLLLLVLQVQVVHNYSFRDTVRVGLVIVFGVAVLLGAIVLVGLLVGQTGSFLSEVVYEIFRMAR